MLYFENSDEELMRLYYGGDDFAFAELHRRFLPPLLAAALRRLPRMPGRREAADELTAQCLVRAAMTRQQPAARWTMYKGPLRPWLFTILHRQVSSYLHRFGRRIPLLSCDSGEDRRVEQILAADDLAPLEQLAQQELQAALRTCIGQLPEVQHQIIAMELDGLRQTDIAEALGVSDATVMRWRHRAYARLVESLQRMNVAD